MIFHLHKRASLLASILLMSLLTPFTSAAGSDAIQEPGYVLAEKTEIYSDRSYGFTIALPKDFQLSSEQGDLLFFQSPDRAGTVIVRPRPGLSVSTVQAMLRNGFENEVIVLTPTGATTRLELEGGRGFVMEVRGSIEGRDVHGLLAGIFGENDQGYVILVGSIRARWQGFKHVALGMLQSFAVKPIQPGFEHERWQYRLNGRRLIYAEDYGTRFRGGIYVGEYHFCSDGTFFQRSDSRSTERYGWSGYSYGTTDKSRGTWQVRIENNKPMVRMRNKRGGVEFVDIAESRGYVLLNGVPYQFAVNELCD